MLTTINIESMAQHLGADLCGVAPIASFSNSPKGFHPTDIYSNTQSVIVIAKREPVSTALLNSNVAYTFVSNMVLLEVHNITMNLLYYLEQNGVTAIPAPSEPYNYWDNETMTGKGILSLKHAGELAGLGVIGDNSLLNNPKYGNLIRLSAILTNLKLTPSKKTDYALNCANCQICINSCPVNAITNGTVNQYKCRIQSQVCNPKNEMLISCKLCRSSCPYMVGMQSVTTKKSFAISSLLKVKLG